MYRLSLVLFLVSLIFAQSNWTGYLDTVAVSGLYGTSTVYGRALILTDYEDMLMVLKVDDTTQAGFSVDSTRFHWGYQTGTLVKTSAGVVDTIWQTEDMICLDTCQSDSFGLGKKGYQATDGSLTARKLCADTSSISGWAIQKRWVVPRWDILIRPWAQGLAVGGTEKGNVNSAAKALKMQFDFIRRIGTRVQNRS